MSKSNQGRDFQVDVDDTPTLVCRERTARQSLTVRVASGDVEYFLRSRAHEDEEAGIEFGGGIPLASGEAYIFDDFLGAVYVICDTSDTADLRGSEVGG